MTQTLQHNIAPVIRPNAGPNAGSQEGLVICTCNHSNQDKKSTSGIPNDNVQHKSCDKDSEINSEKDFEQKMEKNEENNEKDSDIKDSVVSPENEKGISEENFSDSPKISKKKHTQAQDSLKESADCIDVCPDCKKLRNKTKCGKVPTESTSRKISKPYYKFVWNKHLLSGFEGKVHPDWVLHAINGFIGQSSILLSFS